ncbi:MAG: glycosyltransferase family 4 protein [Firmicutes bacterium]|nr:glycosyltransferase family 4 protein [Bacillota bacterium]
MCWTWLSRLDNVPVFYYTTTADLALICERLEPQLIHSHSPHCFNSSVTVSINYCLPLVITLHSTLWVEELYPLTLLMAKKIIAVGPAQARVVPKFQSKTVVIPNGIDLARFRPKRRFLRSKFKLCWFGRVHGEMAMGAESLNRALAIVRGHGIYLEAYFLGNAPPIPKEQFIDLGWLDDPVSVLQRTHVVFGHGRALREAMACGNVGFLLGAGYGGRVTRELIGELQHLDAFPQYHLAQARPERLASDILEFVESRRVLSQFQKEARQIALDYFDVQLMVKGTLSIYEQETLP